jgi:quinol monooxygenase YgiN
VYIVVVNLKVKAECYDEFLRRLAAHVVATRSEGRCLKFEVGADLSNKRDLVYYEEYPYEALFSEHIKSERVARHLVETAPMIDGDLKFKCWGSVSLD